MADYTQTPHRPNIKPTDLPSSDRLSHMPVQKGMGMGSVLGAVAVVGIVAMVIWGIVTNDQVTGTDGQTAPNATQTAPDQAPATNPGATATPGATAPDATAPDAMVNPDAATGQAAPTPQEGPAPADEAAPTLAPTPAPVTPPSN